MRPGAPRRIWSMVPSRIAFSCGRFFAQGTAQHAFHAADDFTTRGGGHRGLVEHADHSGNRLTQLIERGAFERSVSQPCIVAGFGVKYSAESDEKNQTEF
jgi:hypothetical protein